jgi:predicted nucleic acid-binding protein
MKESLLFDASSIFTLVRELKGDAPDILLEGSTISLAFYEVGNALWRESYLLKRINPEKTEILLKTAYAILEQMEIITLDRQTQARDILSKACDFNLTFYDSAYLAQAHQSNKTLVTDDRKLSKAAEKCSIKTLTSKEIAQK